MPELAVSALGVSPTTAFILEDSELGSLFPCLMKKTE